MAAVLIGALLPVAVNFINDTDTSSWGDSETTLYNLLPLVFVLIPFIALVMWVIRVM